MSDEQPERHDVSSTGVHEPTPVTVSFSLTVPGALSPDAVTALVKRSLLGALPDAWEPRGLAVGYGAAWGGALLVQLPDTPPGGVTMLSNSGVRHVTADDLVADEVPTPDEVAAARARLAAGQGTYSDYGVMSRADEPAEPLDDVTAGPYGPAMHDEHRPCRCGVCMTPEQRAAAERQDEQ